MCTASALRMRLILSVSSFNGWKNILKFSVSIAEQEAKPLETLVQAIAAPDSRFYGAFAGDGLVGIVNLQRYGRAKLRHRAIIGSMYVVPQARGQGLGKRLLGQSLERCTFVAGACGCNSGSDSWK